MLKLNETPVRTSRNFNINNIKLENINIPENLENFDGVQIYNASEKNKLKFITKKKKIRYLLKKTI